MSSSQLLLILMLINVGIFYHFFQLSINFVIQFHLLILKIFIYKYFLNTNYILKNSHLLTTVPQMIYTLNRVSPPTSSKIQPYYSFNFTT